MVKGQIDGDVKDKTLAQEYLDVMLPLLPSGATVRVTPMSIKVDMGDVRVYPKSDAETEGVSESDK